LNVQSGSRCFNSPELAPRLLLLCRVVPPHTHTRPTEQATAAPVLYRVRLSIGRRFCGDVSYAKIIAQTSAHNTQTTLLCACVCGTVPFRIAAVLSRGVDQEPLRPGMRSNQHSHWPGFSEMPVGFILNELAANCVTLYIAHATPHHATPPSPPLSPRAATPASRPCAAPQVQTGLGFDPEGGGGGRGGFGGRGS